MKIQLADALLLFPAAICFAEIVRAPQNSDPGPLITAALGIFLLLRGLAAAPQPAVVILSGYVLAGIAVGSNHGIMNGNSILWIGLFVLAAIGFGFWERIQKLWK